MRVDRYFYIFLFFIILFFQTVLIATLGQNVDVATAQAMIPWYVFILPSFLKVDMFTFAVLVSMISIFFLGHEFGKESSTNKKVLIPIIIYCLYQIIVVVPLSYLDGMHSIKQIIFALIPRFALLLIPLFMWRIVPAFKKIEKIFPWIAISALVLIIAAFINSKSGNTFTTNTGQIRYLTSGSVIVFATTFFINFFAKNKKLQNYIFIIVGLMGIMVANFRAAYVFLFFVTLIGLWLFVKAKNNFKTIILSVSVVCCLLFIVAQSGMMWENFSKRLESINMQDENATIRFEYWKLAYQKFTDSPLNGSLAKNEYYRSMYIADYPIPHNFIFEILPTQGLIGLAFFVYLLIQTLAIAYHNRSDEATLQMFLVLLFYVLFSTFNPTFLNPWTMLILITAVSVILIRNSELDQAANKI